MVQAGIVSPAAKPVTNPVATVAPFPIWTMKSDRIDNMLGQNPKLAFTPVVNYDINRRAMG